MKSSIKLSTETYSTDNGGIVAKIWVSDYNTDDPCIFVLQDNYNMLNEKITPLFSTVATPAHLVEYQANYPTEKGGLYRTDHIYITLKNAVAYKEFIEAIKRRITLLCKNIDYLKEDKNYITEEWGFKGFSAYVAYTNSPKYSNCLKVTLPEDRKYFLKGNVKGVSTFIDVCTPEDILVFPDENVENKYRDNYVELCATSKVVLMCKDKLHELLQITTENN